MIGYTKEEIRLKFPARTNECYSNTSSSSCQFYCAIHRKLLYSKCIWKRNEIHLFKEFIK